MTTAPARMLVLLLGLLPLLAFALVMLRLLDAQQRDSVDGMLNHAAKGAALAVERQLAKETAYLESLAGSTALDDGDLDRFRREAQRLLDSRPGWLTVVLTDTERQLFNLRFAPGTELPEIGDRRSLAAALASGQPVVGNVVADRDRYGTPYVAVRVPVQRDGRIVHTLAAAIDIEAFTRVLLDQAVPPRWVVALADSDDLLLARTVGAETYVGTPMASDFIAARRHAGGKPVDVTTREGTRSYGVLAEVAGTTWVVGVAAPVAVVEAPYASLRLAVVTGGTLAAAVTILLILHFVRRHERLRAAEARHAAEQRLARVLQDTSDGVIELGSDWRVLFINKRARQLTTDGRDITGQCFWEVFPAARGSVFEEKYTDVMETGRAAEFEAYYGPLAGWFRVHAVPTTRGIALYFQDVTARRASEAAAAAAMQSLELSEERLRLALLAAGAGTWEHDPASGLTKGDATCAALHGFGPDHIAEPRPYAEWVAHLPAPDRASVDAALAAALAGQARGMFEASYRVHHPDGADRWVVSRGQVERDPHSGAVRRLRGISLDATPAKEAEAALASAKAAAERADQAKSRFLAAASHDLRQPFQAMRLYYEVLASRVTGAQQRKALAGLHTAMGAGQALLNALLDLSTLDAGTIKVERQRAIMSDLLDPLHAEFRDQAQAQGLRLRYVPCSAVVATDPVLLARMVRNLLVNALKFTTAGGVLLGCRRCGESVRVEVWDTGPGIPEDQRREIFEEFTQLGNPERDREKGLGLGLAVVAKTGGVLGHPVEVRSRPGRGSVFSVEVPLAPPLRLRARAVAAGAAE